MHTDKDIERSRYDLRARNQLLQINLGQPQSTPEGCVKLYLQSPYLFYEKKIRQNVSKKSEVLEIGSGSGAHTGVLIETGAHVTASDISARSLEVVEKKFPNTTRLNLTVADMEKLPFPDASFDVVVSAGSLSYGDTVLVMNELKRILRPGGVFICVDSLNHNPIYKLNRWVHYVRGSRTISTLERMPTLELIRLYGDLFKVEEIKFFGGISWLMPLLNLFLKESFAAELSDKFDSFIKVRRSAFKFVMVAKKLPGHGGLSLIK